MISVSTIGKKPGSIKRSYTEMSQAEPEAEIE